jgi:protoporphyrin/coproporphyrin ferrochelatase
MMKRLKQKWNIQSNWQLIIILFIFSATGSAALVVRKLVFNLIGITPETSLWIKVPLYIIVLFPAYQIMLVLIGGLLGQFRFFFEFQKKTFRFLDRKKVVIPDIRER